MHLSMRQSSTSRYYHARDVVTDVRRSCQLRTFLLADFESFESKPCSAKVMQESLPGCYEFEMQLSDQAEASAVMRPLHNKDDREGTSHHRPAAVERLPDQHRRRGIGRAV